MKFGFKNFFDRSQKIDEFSVLETLPLVAQIRFHLDKLQSNKHVFRKKNWVVRSRNHTEAWIKAYIETEILELNESGYGVEQGVGKSEVVIISYDNYKKMKIAFRICANGLSGWTEYGIEVKKIDGYYWCLE